MKKTGSTPKLRSPRSSVPTSPKTSRFVSPQASSKTSKVVSRLASPKPPIKSEETKSLSKRTDGRKPAKKEPPVEKKKPGNYVEAPNATVTEKAKTESDRKLLTNALERHFIFSSLAQEHQGVIISTMKFYRLPARETVFEQGKPGLNFFVLASGALEVVVSGRRVNVIRQGEGFGELALMHDTQRSATVRSMEACTLWGVDGKTFRQFLTTINQQMYAENKAFVTSVPLFAALTAEQKENLVGVLTSQHFSCKQRIVNEGDPGDLFFIIKEGEVSCTKCGVEIRRLGRGEFFGEQALLYGGLRTATVTAVDGPVKTVSICRNDLVEVLGLHLQQIIYRNTLRMACEKNDTLKSLSRDQRERLIDSMRVLTYANGQVVIPVGFPKGSKLWIVLKGAIGPNNFQIVAETLSCVGEIDLRTEKKGAFAEALVAIGDTVHVGEIDRSRFEECLGGDLEEMKVNNETMELMRKVPLLRGLAQDRLPALLPLLAPADFVDGTTIVQQGTPGDALYIIKQGKVDVFRDGCNIRTITKHDYFGERSVLLDEMRTATVVARGEVECWRLSKSDFLRIVDENMRKLLMRRIFLQDDSISLSHLAILKPLGRGNFGTVFLSIHTTKRTLYALKTVRRSAVEAFETEDNLIQERRMLLHLDHPFVVRLIKTFKDAKRLYFLMEFVCGQDLFDVIREIGLLGNLDARFYTAALLLILEYLHERDIIYRDMKPENIMIDEDGYPKLIDFGTAKLIQSRTYTIVGTPHYMAPEVILGKGYGLSADLYSVGILLYEFLCGAVPFGEEDTDPFLIYEKVLEHRIAYPEFMEEKTPAKSVIEKLLAVNPALRVGGGWAKLKGMKWFRGLDWVRCRQDSLVSKQLPPPYTPAPVNLSSLIASGLKRNSFLEAIEVSLTQAEESKQPSLDKPLRRSPPNWDSEF